MTPTEQGTVKILTDTDLDDIEQRDAQYGAPPTVVETAALIAEIRRLRAAEQRVRALVEPLNDGSFVFDRESAAIHDLAGDVLGARDADQ